MKKMIGGLAKDLNLSLFFFLDVTAVIAAGKRLFVG